MEYIYGNQTDKKENIYIFINTVKKMFKKFVLQKIILKFTHDNFNFNTLDGLWKSLISMVI